MDFAQICFKICEITGVIAFSISGTMVAIDKKTDLFGVLFISVITGFGGGMMRDICLGDLPPRVFSSVPEVLICMAAAVAVFIVAAILKSRFIDNEERIENIINVLDAIGLGAFAVTGVRIALDSAKGGTFLVLTMGLITAVGGGLIRDLILREIPFVLKKRIYALAAIFGSAAYLVLTRLNINEGIAMAGGVASTFLVRLMATRFRWKLPKAIK